MSACIDEVASWMSSNRLQLNAHKTEMQWCPFAHRQSTTYLNIPSLHRLCETIHSRSRPRFWRQYAVSGIVDCLTLLRHRETVAHYTAFSVPIYLSVSCRWFGSDEDWLWKPYAGKHSFVSAGGNECSGSTCLPDKSLWSYHSATLPPALASCAAAHIFQAAVMVYQCVRRLGPAYLADAFQPVPRFPVDNACGHCRCRHWTFRLYDCHCRRPSVSRRRGTNMEQFASWSDVIKFPSNLQTKTNISFILGVVSIVPKLLVFVECMKCYGIFHFNVKKRKNRDFKLAVNGKF